MTPARVLPRREGGLPAPPRPPREYLGNDEAQGVFHSAAASLFPKYSRGVNCRRQEGGRQPPFPRFTGGFPA
mgnify:CR=1 FL=1